jgi:hypothetical protein
MFNEGELRLREEFLRRLAVGLGLSEGYATQKRMTGANEGFLEVIGTQASVVEEKLQRADG